MQHLPYFFGHSLVLIGIMLLYLGGLTHWARVWPSGVRASLHVGGFAVAIGVLSYGIEGALRSLGFIV
jgi:hypothetical protein